jgi:3-oxoacyl-[acyl-carrier-protein] synthase-3
MNNYLAKKLKLRSEQVPSCIAQFGNTSSVSIPLTIATQLRGKFDSPKKLILSGFGVGMSWATAFITLDDCQISNLIEL